MVLRSRQAVGIPQIVGNERRRNRPVAGKGVVVDRQHEHMLEIEVARLEYPHDLHAGKRLALVRDAHILQHFAQQRGEDRRRDLQTAPGERVLEPADPVDDHREKLPPLPDIVCRRGMQDHQRQRVADICGKLLP